MSEHERELSRLIEAKACNPELIRWHFIHAALEAEGGNVTKTAKRLGMYRKTVQRAMRSKAPAERWLA